MRHLRASCWPPWSACGSISAEAGWMTQATIRTLRPNVTRQEALRVLNLGGLRGLFWRLRNGPLQRLADVYVPYNLYRVRYEMGGAKHERIFALDAVDGSLDLFEFRATPDRSQCEVLETRNHFQGALDDARAEALLREKVLRVLFQQGFFRLRGAPKLECTRLPLELHMPYWLVFLGSYKCLSVLVLAMVHRFIVIAKA